MAEIRSPVHHFFNPKLFSYRFKLRFKNTYWQAPLPVWLYCQIPNINKPLFLSKLRLLKDTDKGNSLKPAAAASSGKGVLKNSQLCL